MKTACGATLIATQFLAIVEMAKGSDSRLGENSAATSPTKLPRESEEIEEEHAYSLVDDAGKVADEYCYDLFCDDQLQTQASRYLNGETISVSINATSRLVSWLSKDGGEKS